MSAAYDRRIKRLMAITSRKPIFRENHRISYGFSLNGADKYARTREIYARLTNEKKFKK